MVTEWGYCRVKIQDEVAFKPEVEIMKGEVEAGDYRGLLARSKELGLFVPTYTECEQFSDFYPF